MEHHATEQKAAARQFAEFWRGRGYEKGQTQPFWLSLLRVLGVERPETAIEFEDKAHIDAAHGFIDGYIPSTRVMVEQKSLGKNLRAAIPQSDGSLLTPFQQAKRYCLDLPLSRHPRWIVTCNFAEFDIYDMEKPNAEPERLLLDNLPDELYRLHFLVDTGSDTIRREEEISKKAGDVVGLIYDALLKQYEKCENVKMLPITSANTQLETGNNGTGNTSTLAHSAMLASLNELCVRLVFLLYAEDADVFGHLQFHDYLKQFPASKARRALIDLFRVLDTPPDKRDPYLEADLAAFPYVNGGLFANENIEIPQFTDEILDLVLRKGSEDFDWKDISPTIFGAVFESTLNPETRRSGGMHYTSVANIHKVIDPLFLDALTERVEALCKCGNVANNQSQHPIGTGNIGTGNNCTLAQSLSPRQRRDALLALQSELASLTFLDPACGSGNFLTETYISLRRLENRIIAALMGGQTVLDLSGDMVKVSLSQFRGIEINDFAVKVAKTALWIAENQMLRETEAIAHRNLDFLPLKNYDGIVEGNALRLDWREVISRRDAEAQSVYVIGNPPFIGYSLQSDEQKADILALYRDEKGKPYKTAGKIDYVAGWYWKCAELMRRVEDAIDRRVEDAPPYRGDGRARPLDAPRCALVSTNSITQGEQVASVWRPLVERFGVSIDFAHRTFRWDSESNSKAHVHCVIVGFHAGGTTSTLPAPKPLFDGERVSYVPHINAYLFPAPDLWLESSSHPLCMAPETRSGGKPVEGGHLIFTPEEKDAFLAVEPSAAQYFRRVSGSDEYINGIERWCLWLFGISPAALRSMPHVMERVRLVREMRLASVKPATRKAAETPWQFMEIKEPTVDFIAIPEVSSERRRYIPLGYLSKDVVCTNKLRYLDGGNLYHFGVLTSNVHMAWMRTVCGRLKSDYSYSVNIVYNNFPWPGAESNPTIPVHLCVSAPLHEKIEQTAQAILDARAKYPDSSLADLYDELTMPPDLRRAHQENDRAVMAAYGFSTKMTESECVAELFKRYQALVSSNQKRKGTA